MRLFRSLIIKARSWRELWSACSWKLTRHIKTEQTFWYCLTGMWMKPYGDPVSSGSFRSASASGGDEETDSLSLILESGEPREVHHFATLLGYGACAVNPYLALDTIHELIEEEMLDKDYYAAVEDYTLAILHGIVKISSKMGISTIQSYQGAKIFEAIGISKEVTDKYFAGTVSRVGGITMEDIEKQVDEYHTKAFDPLGLTTNLALESMGKHKRRADGEEHRYNPETIHLLQQATWTGNYELFKEYTKKIDAEETGYLRSLMILPMQKKRFRWMKWRAWKTL